MLKTKNKNIFITDTSTNITISDNDVLFLMDFEFNDFKNKKPISIGICSLDKNQQLYREFKYEDDYKKVNDWVAENVIKYLNGTPEKKEKINEDIITFFSQFEGKNIYVMSDHPVDMLIFLELNPKLKNRVNLCLMEHYLMAYCFRKFSGNDEIDSEAKEKEIAQTLDIYRNQLTHFDKYEDYFKDNKIIQHHALNDSIVLATLMSKALEI